ncbi:OmpA family protein [Faecalibacter bovis]|uniref:OmpA family protein n=1 Tax=Faecalibacter bovis TaxID=2898187 RepID=A0ABX7XA51_9FLAO|nr:OmpA family protein [Faecalibacter bovis]QTV04755.1 OmpA family protein [Faecalibacter bovis]
MKKKTITNYMRYFSQFIILFLGFLQSSQAQTIFPYLEVKNNTDFVKISSDSIDSNYQFNHFLGDIQHTFYYKNISNETIDLRFVVPQHHSQNVYHLSSKYNNQESNLLSKPIVTVRQEIKSLKSKSGYDNQTKTQNLILNLNQVKAGEMITVSLKISKIIETNTLDYELEIPEIKTIRTEQFTSLGIDEKIASPKKASQTYNFTGSIPLNTVLINKKNPTIKKVTLTNWVTNSNSTAKENILYSYDAKQINSAVQHFTEDGCDYILGIVQPPKDPKIIYPREYIFVVDASGSMKGRPITEVKKMMISTLRQLKTDELFNIVLYGTNQENFAPTSVEASKENVEKAILYIEKEYGRGATKLNEAIDRIQTFKANSNHNRIITIISDGDLDINQNLHLSIKSHLKSAQFFILGIGNSIDYRAMNFLSLTTGAQPLVINNEYELGFKIAQFQKQILRPLLRNVQVQSKTINLSETYPKNFNGFLSTNPIHFVSKDCKKVYPKQLEITAKNGIDNYNRSFDIQRANSSNLTEAIKFYWAKQKIDFLLKDEDRCGEICKKDGRYRKEIEKIGMSFNLSTPYTVLIQNNDTSNFNQDYDSDGDGIADWYDECINEKGTLLTKGCPVDKLEGNSKDVYVQDFSNELIRTVEFDFDQTIIRTVDYPILDRIVKIMKSNPHLKFYVEGHTDAMGSSEYNKNLSLNRSKAVVEYFTNKGLDKNRFTIIGKGDTELKHTMCRPAENCEAWKNLQNRRVEFKIKKD